MPDHPLQGKTIEYTGWAWSHKLQQEILLTRMPLCVEEFQSDNYGSGWVCVVEAPGCDPQDDINWYTLDPGCFDEPVYIINQWLPHMQGAFHRLHEIRWDAEEWLHYLLDRVVADRAH